MLYNVTEIFQSIQGEGLHVGLYCNFIRLAGCPLNCTFCDTDKETMGKYTIYAILRLLDPMLDHVVLTGGEPTAQDIEPLCIALQNRGYKVHLETSGWAAIPRRCVDFISLSPKAKTIDRINNPSFLNVEEVKWLVPAFGLDDINWNLADVHWLQPINEKKTLYQPNLERCLMLLQQAVVPVGKSLRLSVQLHKLINVK